MGKQTRFLVLMNGTEQQLFSVREDSEGAPVFLFKFLWSGMSGQMERVKDFHVTAHMGREHGQAAKYGYKINYTLITEDGTDYDRSRIVKDNKRRGLLWPVINGLIGRTETELAVPRIKKDDRVVRLIGWKDETHSLAFTIYAHDKGVVLPQIQGFSKVHVPFSGMDVTVYLTFLRLPQVQICLGPHEWPPLRKDGVMIEGQAPVRPIMSPNGVEKYLHENHRRQAGFLTEFWKLVGFDHIPEVNIRFFSRWSVCKDEEHRNYGEAAIAKNEKYEAPKFPDGSPKPAGFESPAVFIQVPPNPHETGEA